MGRRKKTDVTDLATGLPLMLIFAFIALKMIATFISEHPWILLVGVIGIFIFLVAFIIQKIKSHRFITYDLSEIDKMNPYKFEEYIRDLYIQCGYNAKCTPRSGDYGADVIIQHQDYKATVQVKHYGIKTKTGVKAVQEVIASMPYYNANNGIVITTSYFTSAAINLAERAGVELIDRDGLKELLYQSSLLCTT